MSVDVVLAEALHAKVVDETILRHLVHVRFDFLVLNVSRDKPQSNREPVTIQGPELQWLENALKSAYFDLGVPVLASLLPDQLLSIHPMDSHPLGGNSSLVFVASDLELSRNLA